MKYKLQLDFTSITTDDLDNMQDLNITFQVITWVGPGGGNPLLELYGTKENLEMYLAHYYSQDSEDMKHLVTLIQEDLPNSFESAVLNVLNTIDPDDTEDDVREKVYDDAADLDYALFEEVMNRLGRTIS
jgi:hypothetical protein